MIFVLLDAPVTIATSARRTPRCAARTSTISSFARPSTGGAVTLTTTTPSFTATPRFDALGFALTVSLAMSMA